jgi:hypothetical protein
MIFTVNLWNFSIKKFNILLFFINVEVDW